MDESSSCSTSLPVRVMLNMFFRVSVQIFAHCFTSLSVFLLGFEVFFFFKCILNVILCHTVKESFKIAVMVVSWEAFIYFFAYFRCISI